MIATALLIAMQAKAVTFVVRDSATAKPLERASIAPVGGTPVFTSANGIVTVDPTTLKGGSLLVRKLGFKPETLSSAQVAGDTIRIAMYKLSELPAVAVVGRTGREDFTGFERRCSAIYAECFGVDELAQYPARRLSDFLAKISGAKRECAGTLDNCTILVPSTIGDRRCAPTYFLDGHKWEPGIAAARTGRTNPLSDIEKFAGPSQIKGIEVYRAGQKIPPRFEAGNGCGSIVLWTK
jgi:hypothetical protein